LEKIQGKNIGEYNTILYRNKHTLGGVHSSVSFLVKYFIIKKLTPTNTVRGVCANNKQTKSFSNIYRWHIANVDGDSDVDADPLFTPIY